MLADLGRLHYRACHRHRRRRHRRRRRLRPHPHDFYVQIPDPTADVLRGSRLRPRGPSPPSPPFPTPPSPASMNMPARNANVRSHARVGELLPSGPSPSILSDDILDETLQLMTGLQQFRPTLVRCRISAVVAVGSSCRNYGIAGLFSCGSPTCPHCR